MHNNVTQSFAAGGVHWPCYLNAMNDSFLDFAVRELTQKHHCHTVILYGSRARGDATEESDYDLVGFRDVGEKIQDARFSEGKFLDAFVYSPADVEGKEHEFLRLRNGKVLVERETFAQDLLLKIEMLFRKGPPAKSENEIQATRIWIQKMLARSARGDLEGNFRRSWLEFSLLEGYFELRGKWYLGPKESFRWLSENDLIAHQLFDFALRPDSGPSELRSLVDYILAI